MVSPSKVEALVKLILSAVRSTLSTPARIVFDLVSRIILKDLLPKLEASVTADSLNTQDSVRQFVTVLMSLLLDLAPKSATLSKVFEALSNLVTGPLFDVIWDRWAENGFSASGTELWLTARAQLPAALALDTELVSYETEFSQVAN